MSFEPVTSCCAKLYLNCWYIWLVWEETMCWADSCWRKHRLQPYKPFKVCFCTCKSLLWCVHPNIHSYQGRIEQTRTCGQVYALQGSILARFQAELNPAMMLQTLCHVMTSPNQIEHYLSPHVPASWNRYQHTEYDTAIFHNVSLWFGKRCIQSRLQIASALDMIDYGWRSRLEGSKAWAVRFLWHDLRCGSDVWIDVLGGSEAYFINSISKHISATAYARWRRIDPYLMFRLVRCRTECH